MNNTQFPAPDESGASRSLDQRFAQHPQVSQRLHEIADQMERAIEDGHSGDQAEEMAIQQTRKLGADILTDWAKAQSLQSVQNARAEHPEAITDGKKKLQWLTTFGPVLFDEPVLRLGRRGRRYRPFSVDARITNRCSLRLQRVLVDFGAESSFSRAVLRVGEHYGVDVSRHALYTQTLKHSRAMGGFVSEQEPAPASELLTQIDGSMIPIMTPGKGADRRCGKTLSWGEVRLCSARVPGMSQPIYGASRGSCQTIALTWEHTAKQSGWTPQTRVHGVGDGAPWIADKFRDLFGKHGTYLIDFYHVSEYLAQAAGALKNTEAGAARWRRCQQGRLLKNQSAKVLRALEQEQPEENPDHPVTKAHRYLKEREDHLDYQGARAADRPIGSGEIESGHRHVIQQRLKLAGAWWKESHIQPMLNLRVLRANQLWDEYWQTLQN